MKRVVIIGSKPDAIIPDGDIVYCSNGSLGLYSENVKRFKNIVCIATLSTIEYLQKNRDEGNPYRKFNVKTWNMLTTTPKKIVVISNKNITQTLSALKNDGCDAATVHMIKYERRKLIGKISGCHDPIVTKDLFLLPISLRLKYIKSIIKIKLKRIIKKQTDSNCVLRPSTGILSIVYAISENGKDAEYIVSGIGLEKRGIYSEGKNEDLTKKNPLSHIFADKKVLQELVKRYRIYTTEPELMDIIPPLDVLRQ